MRSAIGRAAAVLFIVAAFANPALAGKGPVVVSPMVFVPPAVFSQVDGPQVLNAATTDQIVQSLEAAKNFCAGIGGAYSVDCLAERMAATAAAMPDTGQYAPAKAAIADAADKLHALARQNAATDLPRVRASQGETRTTRPIIPVAPAAQPAVNAQAAAILDEAATVLLRSADSDPVLGADYTQIAAAVGSNKVLLRST